MSFANSNNAGAGSASDGLCRAGCGFFGNATFQGYCSKCYRDLQRTPAAAASPSRPSDPVPPAPLGPAAVTSPASGSTPARPAASPDDVEMGDAPAASAAATASASSASHVAAASPTPSASSAAPSTPAPASAPAADDKSAAVQANKSRCWNCKKKVGLTGFECRCGFTFCGSHRHADQHACSFDFKSHDRAVLDKLNPKVQAAKVDKL